MTSSFFLLTLCVFSFAGQIRVDTELPREKWYRMAVTVTNGPSATDIGTPLFALCFTKSAAYGVQRNAIVWSFSFSNNKPILHALTHYSADTGQDRLFETALEPDSQYVLETGYRFRGDSLILSLYCNGAVVALDSNRFFLERQFLSFVRITDTALCGWRIRVPEFASSEARLFTSPPIPIAAYDSVDQRGRISLGLGAFSTRYLGEALSAVHWRMRKSGQPGASYLDELSGDPAFLDHIRIPNFCDSGDYVWQARYRNNFNAWGGWSLPCTITVNGVKPKSFSIDSLWMSKAGGRKPLIAVQRESWHRIWLKVRRIKGDWDEIGYFVVRLSRADYPYGSPVSKGGVFRASENYVFNLSAQGVERGWALLEKTHENLLRTDILEKGAVGVTVDESPGSIITDTVNGLFSFRFRLLRQALPGPWQAAAYVVAADKNHEGQAWEWPSDLHITGFTVLPSSSTRFPVWLIGVALVIGLWLVFRRAKSPAIQSDDPAFKRIQEYIEGNLGNPELTAEKIRTDLVIGKNRFFSILGRNKIDSLPAYINELRIAKARELFKDPTQNVTEVGFAVGYSDTPYFSRIFKSLTGSTPSEYRKNLHL